MVSTEACTGASECVAAFRRYARTSESTSRSSVALNSRRWPFGFVMSRISRTTGRKPMSAIWSASSSTVMETSDRSTEPRLTRSISRPGVATSTVTPRSRARTCLAYGMPPAMRRTLSPVPCASGARVSLTCMASSRVGTSTSPRGRWGAARRPESRVSSASPKASVLPEPVCPRPRMSRPAMASGRVAAWIGNGSVIPPRVRTGTRSGCTPSSANVGVLGTADKGASIRDDWRVSNGRPWFGPEQDSQAALRA